MVNGLLILILIVVLVVIILVIWLIMWLISRSKGKIQIVLDNYNFSPGDTISGKLNLKIKKPIQSKALTIRLIGEKIQSNNINLNSRQGNYPSNSTNYQRIFDFSEPIEGPKEFQPNQELNYDFKIKIPQNLIKSPQLTGVLGAIESLSMINTMVKWYLIADLDIPGIDISNKIQINIG